MDEEGRFRLDPVPGDCKVRALRMDGQMVVPGPWVPVSPRLDRPSEVHLELPEREQGILGIWVEEAPGGLEITRVLPGTPGERADLWPGDLVTAVDGLPAEDMTHDDWIDEVTGPVGEAVTLEVHTSPGTRTVELVRQIASSP